MPNVPAAAVPPRQNVSSPEPTTFLRDAAMRHIALVFALLNNETDDYTALPSGIRAECVRPHFVPGRT